MRKTEQEKRYIRVAQFVRWRLNGRSKWKETGMHMQCFKMMGKVFVLTLVLLLLALDVHARRDRYERESESYEQESRGRRRGERSFQDLKPRKPREMFKSDGGRIEAYDADDYPALCDAEFGVKRVTVEQNGLVLPAYKDADVLLTVTEGRLRAGIVSPFSDKVTERSVFELRKGDSMAIPRGFTTWFYNDGNERARFIDFADTTTSNECGYFQTFHLAGGTQESQRSRRQREELDRPRRHGDESRRREGEGEEMGTSLLHGFSKKMLAHAWGVDEDAVQRVLEGQSGSMIVKVSERQRRDLPSVTNNGIYMDFVYRLGDAQPDIKVPRGGEFRQLNSLKMPLLKEVGLSVASFKLESGALVAPCWAHNAHKVIYVNEGRGKVEVVRENGERAVAADMDEGSLIVIPANYPSVKLAGNEGFDFSGIYKTHMPIESFLAGRNSVYKGLPRSVVSSSLQIDEKLQHQLEQRRTEEAFIFPSRHQTRLEDEKSFQFVENLVRVLG